MLKKILTDEQEELLRDERRVLSRLQAALARFDVAPEQQAVLTASVDQLDELFLLVIVGEFNAGKSAFINALLGSRVVQEGVTPTTSQSTCCSTARRRRPGRQGGVHERHRAGADPARDHTSSTRRAPTPSSASTRRSPAISCPAPTSCCSSPRPTARSPRASARSWRRSASWGKKVVIVINKIDILGDRRRRAAGRRVRAREHRHAARLRT